MTDGRKRDSVPCCRVPNNLIYATIERKLAIRCLEDDPVNVRIGHFLKDRTLYALWIVKAAILAVGSFPRFAAPEMAGRDRLSIAFMGQKLDEPGFVLDLFVQNSRGQIVRSRVLPERHIANCLPATNGASFGFEQHGQD